MKSILLILCVLSSMATLPQFELNDGNNFKIHGKITGIPNNTNIYLVKRHKVYSIDTVQITKVYDYKFKFNGVIQEAGDVYFIKIDTTNIKEFKSRQTDIPIFIDNTEIFISGNINSWPSVLIKGSKSTDSYHKIVNQINAFNATMQAKSPDATDQAASDAWRSEYSNKIADILMDFPDEYAAAAILGNYTTVLSNNHLTAIYNGFTERIRNSVYGKELKEILKFKTISKSVAEGKKLPDFDLVTKNGVLSVQSVYSKNKLTLIDFWASWCTPCRKEIPELKEIYAQYNKMGFDIISISSDKYESDWTDALTEEGMPWLQAREIDVPIGKYIFGITSIPTYLLVDQSGKMIAFECGQGLVQSFGPKVSNGGIIEYLSEHFKSD